MDGWLQPPARLGPLVAANDNEPHWPMSATLLIASGGALLTWSAVMLALRMTGGWW